MLERLHHLFSALCGQNPEHLWAPGGMVLPCCQRCTGLYLGAAAALVLHAWLRPRLTGRFLMIHGAFLLQMVPFGFHWLPQGALLRTGTGLLYGFGVSTFLWLLPEAEMANRKAQRTSTCASSSLSRLFGLALDRARQPQHRYWAGFFCVLVFVPAALVWGGLLAAWLLSLLIAAGALAFAILVLANLAIGVRKVLLHCASALRCRDPLNP